MSKHRATRAARRRTWYGRKAKPGHVFVSKNELIELLRASLRVAELQAELAALEAQATQARDETAARDRAEDAASLLRRRVVGAGVTFSALEARGLLADPPATERGSLDEAAFTNYVDGHIWNRRLDQITTTS